MFDAEKKLIERMAPLLKRVLIVDPQAAGGAMIAEAMREVSRGQIWTAGTQDRGLKLCETVDPQVIFVEAAPPTIDAAAFTRKLRRGHATARKAPVIMVVGTVTAGAILAARDAGVHEFLRKPFTMKDLLRRLEAVTLRQRDWIEAIEYVGPDRRRFNSGDYAGPLKRRDDTRSAPDAERLAQALKILRAAIGAFDRDPVQARRAIDVQLADIKAAATLAKDLRLIAAGAELQRYLMQAAGMEQPLCAAELQARSAALLAYTPKDERAAA